MASAADLYELLNKIRYDTTAIQARVTDALKILGELNVEDKPKVTCPSCGIPLRGPRTLAEHLYQMHDGPLPEHWVSATRAAERASEAAMREMDEEEERGEAASGPSTTIQA